MIIIDTSKKSAKSSTKHFNSKMFCINVLFFFTNLAQGNFYIAWGFLYCQLRVLILPVPLLKWRIFSRKDFRHFYQNTSLDEYSPILSHVNQVFVKDDRDWIKKSIVLLCKMFIKNYFVRPQIFRCANYNLKKEYS